MRARTLSPSSSFLVRSFGLSGSRWPSFHWPSPRLRLTEVVVLGGMNVPPDRGRALRPVRAAAPGAVVGTGAGLAAVSTERAAHPVQVHVAAGHEAQGQRRHAVKSAT